MEINLKEKKQEKTKQVINGEILSPSYVPTSVNLTRSKTKPTTEVRQRDFLQCYVKNYGLVYKTLQELRIGQHTVERWKKQAEFKKNLDTAQQKVNEMMENSLINKALTTKSPVPEIFYLRSRDARYSQQVTLQGDTDKPIVVTHSEDTLKLVSKVISNIVTKE